MPTMTVGVQVYRRNIASQFLRGGQGYRWLDGVKLAMFRECVKTAPNRTGQLAGLHRSNIKGGVNQYRTDVTISNLAEHSMWVHEGTNGMKAKGKKLLILPPGGPGRNTVSPYAGQTFGKIRKKRVNGQDPNPWLDNACAKIAMSRGAHRVS